MDPSAVALLALIIFVDDAGDASNEAMRAAAREALGAGLEIRVEPESNAGAGEVIASPQTAVVHVHWDAAATTAVVQRAADPTAAAVERRVTFSEQDSAEERGRTLGYLIAALLPLPEVTPRSLPPAPAEPAAPALVDSERSPPLLPARQTSAVSLYGAMSIGLGDDGASTAFGGGAAASWLPGAGFALSLRVEARAGSLGEAQASTLFLAAKGGAAFRTLQLGAFALWLRADMGVARESVTHFSSDDPEPVERAHFLPVSDAVLELGLRLGPGLGLGAGFGADVVWGTTDVFVRNEQRASLASVRPLLSLGVTASF